MSTEPTQPNEEETFDRILAALGELLAKPGDDLPSVRSVSRARLSALIAAAIPSLPLEREIIAADVLERMIQLKLVRPIPFDAVSDPRDADKFYSVGFGAEPSDIHPFELLQTLMPDGVICYMSALELHELTTQPTAHHHIARIETAPTRAQGPADYVKPATPSTRPPSKGRWQFTFHGLKYFLTTREPRRLLNHQRRYLNDKSWYRITTLEQTLIDTLHRPLSCGGPAVVFEAWQAGARVADVAAMITLVDRIGDERLNRRVGYMSQQNVEAFEPLLRHVRSTSNKPDSPDPLPLFQGVQFSNVDQEWGLLVP